MMRHHIGRFFLVILYALMVFGHALKLPGFSDWQGTWDGWDFSIFLYSLIFLVVMFLNPLRIGRIDLTLSLAALFPMFLSLGSFWTFIGLWIALLFRLYQRGVSVHRWVYLQNVYGWAYLAAVLSYGWTGGAIRPEPVGLLDVGRGLLFAIVFYGTNVLLVTVYNQWMHQNKIRLTPAYGWIIGSAVISVVYGELSYWLMMNLSLAWSIALAVPLIVLIYLTRYYYELYVLVRTIERVHTLSKRLFATRRLSDALTHLREALHAFVEHDRMMVCLRDDPWKCYGDRIHLDVSTADVSTALEEIPAAQVNILQSITAHDPEGRLVFGDGPSHQPALPYLFDQVQAALVLPLHDVQASETVGALGWVTLCRVTRHPFTETEEHLGRIMTAYAEPAIRRVIAYERDERSSTVDALTGIPLYRAVEDVLEAMLHTASLKHEPLSVIMLDLDHFKVINDTFGHEAGNEVLKETVRRIQNHIREDDMFCRYGGEEFLLVLPRTTSAEALQLAERIRMVLEREACPYHPRASRTTLEQSALEQSATMFIRVTASFGIATFPEDGEHLHTLIGQADRAMYVGAKRRGRNRVALSSDGLSSFVHETPS